MHPAVRTLVVALACLALPGCYVKTYGVQGSGNGQSTTVTATQVSGSASFSGGRASFSTGQVPPAGTPGGHAYFSKSASAVVVGVLLVSDFFNYMAGYIAPKPLAPDTKIMETCSCYQQGGDEVTK
jgi:hypothetical protein